MYINVHAGKCSGSLFIAPIYPVGGIFTGGLAFDVFRIC